MTRSAAIAKSEVKDAKEVEEVKEEEAGHYTAASFIYWDSWLWAFGCNEPNAKRLGSGRGRGARSWHRGLQRGLDPDERCHSLQHL